MADVRGRERAQLFLIGALSLAITLIALALVLNSAIYTENLATRGADQTGATRVLVLQDDVRAGVGNVVEETNAEASDYSAKEADLGPQIASVETQLRRYEVRSGSLLHVDNPVATEGARIYQSTDDTFDPPSGSGNWIVADDVRTRQFTLTANRASLEDEIGDDTFGVVFDDGTGEWTVRVFTDDPSTSTFVRITDPSGGTITCQDSASSETAVDFSAATVGGNHCRGLEFFDEMASTYDVQFINPTAGEGTYSLTVNKPESSLVAGYPAADGEPAAEEVVYDVTMDFSYQTPDLTYEATLRVAPGERGA